MERESGISLALQTRKSRPQRTTGLLCRLREEMQGPEAGKGRRRERAGGGAQVPGPSCSAAVGSAGQLGRGPAAAPDLPGRGLMTRRDVSLVWRPIGSPLPPFSRVGKLVAEPEAK